MKITQFTSLAVLVMLMVPGFAFADNDSSDDYYRPKPARLCPNGKTFLSNCTELPTGTAAADNRTYSQSVSNSQMKPLSRLEMYRLMKQGLAPSMSNDQKAGPGYGQPYGSESSDRPAQIPMMKPMKKPLPALNLSSSQVSCLESALEARHTAISNARATHLADMNEAQSEWISDIVDAYSNSDTDAQKSAFKSAGEARQEARKSADKTHKEAVMSARDTFKSSMKSCNISEFPESEIEGEVESNEDMMSSPDYN